MAKGNSNPLAVPIPIFTGENYDVWSIKMKTYFLSQDLWDIVNDGFYDPTYTVFESEQQQKQLKESKKNDAAALFILQQAVDDNIFPKISLDQTANEAWCTLKKEFQGVNPQTTVLAEGIGPEVSKNYLPLYKAILEGDLNSVRKLCDEDNKALEARITINLDTALHVAVGTGKANHIVEYLLNKMSVDQISLKNKEGNTVLSIAAIVGNVQAARKIITIDLNQTLIKESNKSRRIPLIEATRHSQKKMVKYLLQFSNEYLDSATSFTSGLIFAKLLITAEFYDLALDFLKTHRSLATMTLYGGESLLSEITKKPSAFPSGRTRKLPFWEYVGISKVTSYTKKKKGETKLMHDDNVLELVRHLCKVIVNDIKDYRTTSLILKRPLLLAAKTGICEIVEAIVKSYPDAIWLTNEKNQNVLHLAVMNRQEKVFNLIYQMINHKNLLLMSQYVDTNILYLAGQLAPKNKLNVIAGAALQMQRELQWFKEVEKIVQPALKGDKNFKDQTPAMVFTEEHKELVKEGEKWVKDTASSCSVAAALIATIVFAAAITVPGDYNNNGHPNFYKDAAFKIFSISDALSLSSSIAAIIMFLSILTARYAEYDFLYSLPKRLIWGLFMLFLSLTTLMVAFCAAFFLVSAEEKVNWFLGLVVVSALVPVYMYAVSQFPLLCELFISTYRPGIFRKQPLLSDDK